MDVVDGDIRAVRDIHEFGIRIDVGDLADGDAFGNLRAFGQFAGAGGVLLCEVDGSSQG